MQLPVTDSHREVLLTADCCQPFICLNLARRCLHCRLPRVLPLVAAALLLAEIFGTDDISRACRCAALPVCPIVPVSPVPVHPPYRLRGVLTSSQEDPCDPPTVTADGVEQLGAVTGDFGARFTLLPPYLHSDA